MEKKIHFCEEEDMSSKNYEKKVLQPWFGFASHLILRLCVSYLKRSGCRAESIQFRPPHLPIYCTNSLEH